MEERIVITGIGVISAIGKNREEFTENLFNSSCGITKQSFSDLKGTHEVHVGKVKNFPEHHSFFELNGMSYDRTSHLALIAAEECMEQANLNQILNPNRAGVILGTSLGGMLSGDEFHTQWLTQGLGKADKRLLQQYPLHAVADVLALRFGLGGIKSVISTACAAGSNAIGYAMDMIQSGKCDFILAGGTDPLSRFSFGGFRALKALAPEACSPYSLSNGINLGEGAAFFVVESFSSAKKRGVTMLAEICGYALTSDAYHQTAPDVGGYGAVRSMRKALENSGISLDQVSYINGHGTGTTSNDIAETRAVNTVFGGVEKSIPLTSNKSSFGHCLGAAGAVEAVASVVSITNNRFPPTLNFQGTNYPGIEVIENKTDYKPCNVVVSNSFAFGGNNCSLVFSKVNEKVWKNRKDKSKDKIVITGIGCTGSGGADIAELWKTFDEGKNWIVKKGIEGNDCNCQFQGSMPDVKWKKYIPQNMYRRIDTITKLAMSSGKQALIDAKVNVTTKNCESIGVIYGTFTGPLETIETISASIINKGIHSVNPQIFPNSVVNSAPGNFCIANQLKGPTTTLASGNNATLNALTYAYEQIKNQQAEAIVVLGADECSDTLITGMDCVDKVSTDGRKPFCKNSNGMILSPGSTAFVIETEISAKKRGAPIYAEILGYAATSDHIPFNKGANKWEECVKLAIEDSGVDHISLYVANAYGIPKYDQKEDQLIQSLFDEKTSVSCTSPLIGIPSSTTGGYNMLNAIYMMQTGKALPIPKSDNPLKSLEKIIVQDNARRRDIKTAVVSTASFGGSYQAVVIGKYGEG